MSGIRSLVCHSVEKSVGFPRQHSFFCRLTEDKKSERFFKVFYDRMKVAQQEIKATVTVNTSDLGNKKKDDEVDRDAPSRKKGKWSRACSPSTSWNYRLQSILPEAFRRSRPVWLQCNSSQVSRAELLKRWFGGSSCVKRCMYLLLGQAQGFIGRKSICNLFL